MPDNSAHSGQHQLHWSNITTVTTPTHQRLHQLHRSFFMLPSAKVLLNINTSTQRWQRHLRMSTLPNADHHSNQHGPFADQLYRRTTSSHPGIHLFHPHLPHRRARVWHFHLPHLRHPYALLPSRLLTKVASWTTGHS